MLPRNHPDRIQITFDDRRLVANAGLLLPATLARHLGLPELVRQRLDLGDAPGRANTSDKMMTLVASALAGGDCIDDADMLRTGGTACTLGGTVKAPSTLGTFLRSFRWGHVRHLGDAPGRANTSDKMMTLVASALAGGDCIDDADMLRTGGTACTLGGTVKAPSTLGTFLRSFRWGHVRQLDRVSRELLARAWQAGAGPGDGPLTIDLDSTICETYGLAKEGARHHGYTGKRGYHPLLAVAADVAETTCTLFQAEADAAPVRLIVRRVKPTPGSQLALFAQYSYHGFITDRDGELLELEADHRRHAEIENAIRDLKYGVGLNHLPSGRFAANGAWLAVQTMGHNLARWTARIGLGERIATTKTLRRRFFSLAGRLTRSARRLTLHLPDRWPWAEKFSRALARLRAIPLPA